MAGESILVVEDNETNLKLTCVLLASEGYEIRTARDGPEALHILESSKPDLILMDVQLPGMNGLEVTRLIKENPKTEDIPVVALTAYAMTENEAKAFEVGCQGYITKPVDTRAFSMQVRRHLKAPSGDSRAGRRITTILIAEDDPVQERAAEERLTEEGFQVRYVFDGLNALLAAHREPPDLVLADLVMPGMNGFDLCRSIRTSQDLASTHVVLTTSGSIQESDEVLASRVGATAFVPKTDDCGDILEAIARASHQLPRSPAPGVEGLDAVRAAFVREAADQIETLRRSEQEGLDVNPARRIAHHWVGTGASLGYPNISEEAAVLERELEKPAPDRERVSGLVEELARLFDAASKSR